MSYSAVDVSERVQGNLGPCRLELGVSSHMPLSKDVASFLGVLVFKIVKQQPDWLEMGQATLPTDTQIWASIVYVQADTTSRLA